MLETLGLDASAERVYREMLDHADYGVEDLAEQLGVQEDAVRLALDQLFDFMLVQASRDDPQRLRAVPLDIGLHRILARQQAEVAQRQARFAQSQAAVNEMLAERYRSGATTEPDVERLTGIDQIYDRLAQLAAETRTECLSVMPGGAQSEASLLASRPLDMDALVRGVDVRTLYQDSVRNDPATLTYARWLTDAGGEVRTVPVTPPRMLVLDRRVALVAMDPDHSRVGALQIESPGLIASLLSLFDRAWHGATPLGADRTPDAVGLNATQRELLRLQAQGLTDEACAGRLGISARTARRMMAELMERLNARSRFEAGLKAARRGWL